MALKINSEIPNLEIKTTQGLINTHEWSASSWGIIFSHPKKSVIVSSKEPAHKLDMEEFVVPLLDHK